MKLLRYRATLRRRTATSSALAFAVIVLHAQTASAADCGDGVAPCACGDVVVSDLVLQADIVCPQEFGGVALSVGADGVVVSGQGYAVVAERAHTMLDIGAHSNVTVRDLDLSTTGDVPTKKFGVVIGSYGGPGVASNAGGHDNLVDNVDVSGEDSQGRGVVIWPGSSGNQVLGCTANGKKVGIYLLQATGNVVAGNSASFGTPAAGEDDVGVELIGASDNVISGNSISGRVFGINVIGDAGWGSSDANLIDGNVAVGNVRGATQAYVGFGNRYLDNDFSASSDVALAVNGDSGVTIAGNDYSGSASAINLAEASGVVLGDIAAADLAGLTGAYGIRLVRVHDATLSNIVVDPGARISLWLTGSTHNTITGLSAPGWAFGVYAEAGSDGNLFEGVDASGAGVGNGVELRASSDNVVRNSTVVSRTFGVHILLGAAGNVVDGNRLTSNNWGVRALGPGQGNRFLDNDVSASTGIGIGVDGDHGVVVSGNFYDGSRTALSLANVSGVLIDGEALANATTTSLSLSGVTDSVLSNLSLGGRYAVSARGSHANTFTNLVAAPPVPSPVFGFDFRGSDSNAFFEVHVSGYQQGFYLEGSHNSIDCSHVLTNGAVGIDSRAEAVGNVVRHTEIAGHSTAGVRNLNAAVVLDARGNAWGDPTGPAPAGSGDAISGPVDASAFFASVSDLDAQCGRRLPPAQVCSGLMALIGEQPWSPGIRQSIAAKLSAACHAIDRGSYGAAINILAATARELEALVGVHLDASAATDVIDGLRALGDQLAPLAGS